MIDINLFDLTQPVDPELRALLANSRPQLAAALHAALIETASFSERYLSQRRSQQLADDISVAFTAAISEPSSTNATLALEQLGNALAEAGLLREILAWLSVALTETLLTSIDATATAERHSIWLHTGALLVSRAVASIQAGFEEGRRKRILEQQEGMLQALIKTLAERDYEQQQLLSLIDVLSTPVVPVFDGVLVLPLIGTLDSRRAQQITEQVLCSIERDRADTIIIDITGVVAVDTQVAQVLLQTAQAARLLGAEAILVGITPEVAQTVVGLGLDLRNLRTFADLQAGVKHALARRGLRIDTSANGHGRLRLMASS